MGVRNVVPIHDIVKPDIFEDKIELISTCEMSIDELKAFALVLKYAAVVMKKDGITKESIKKASVVFLGGDELIIDEEDEQCCASTFSLIIYHMNRLRKANNFLIITYAYIEEIVHHFWNIHDETEVKYKGLEIMKYLNPNVTIDTLKRWNINWK